MIDKFTFAAAVDAMTLKESSDKGDVYAFFVFAEGAAQ